MSRATHLFMVRPNLEAIPPPVAPSGLALRTYMPGDENAWLRIVRAAYGGTWPADAFDRCVRTDRAFRPERLFLATDGVRPVGTAAALQKLVHGDRTGYVHMIAVMPQVQRRGLGSALLRSCLVYFREQGWRDAVLDTEATRRPAILLHLAHGFLPLPENDLELRLWRDILKREGRTGMAQRLRLRACPQGYDDA